MPKFHRQNDWSATIKTVESKKRKDIQALRGIAVIAVVLFHSKESLFKLGFLGVDVFFIISGFVVMPLILRIFENTETPKDRLENLLNFYKRRFFRLIPALGTTLIISTPLIFFLGNLGDHQRFARQGIATLLLIGNVGAFKYSGNYFSPNPNPLIHTWSLSVEEQIYIILPVLIFLIVQISRPKRQVIFRLIMSIFFLSFLFFSLPQLLPTIYSLLSENNVTELIFYSPFSRIWQFCLGAIAYFLSKAGVSTQIKRSTLNYSLIGLTTFIMLPSLSIETTLASLIASFITFAVLSFQSLIILPKPILNPLEWVGNRSYSIYLVHMPLIYLAKYAAIDILIAHREAALLGAVILSFILGGFQFSIIEQKYRMREGNSSQQCRKVVAVIILFVLVPGSLFVFVDYSARDSYQSLVGKNSLQIMKDGHQLRIRGCAEGAFDPRRCLWPTPRNKGTILLVGDSQAYAAADGVIEAANSLHFNVVANAKSSCPFLELNRSGDDAIACLLWREEILRFIGISKPKIVVIANRTNGYLNPLAGWGTIVDSEGKNIVSKGKANLAYKVSLEKTVRLINDFGGDVIIIQNIPEPRVDLERSLLQLILKQQQQNSLPIGEFFLDSSAIRIEKDLAALNSRIYLVKPSEVLCSKSSCLVKVGSNVLYRDSWHLSVYGSLRLTSLIRQGIMSLDKS